jgi:uncharacterized membrane protein YfcA
VLLETFFGLFVIAGGIYFVASSKRLAEKWERENREPGRVRLFRPRAVRASEVRRRAVVAGSIWIVIGALSLFDAFR